MSAPDDGVTMFLDLTGLGPARATVGHSHRATTSSRHPGVTFTGTVAYRLAAVVRCPLCGGWRRESPYPHSPQLRPGGRFDCIGRPLP